MIKLALFSKFQNYIPTNLPNTCQLLAKCLPKLANRCSPNDYQTLAKFLPNFCQCLLMLAKYLTITFQMLAMVPVETMLERTLQKLAE